MINEFCLLSPRFFGRTHPSSRPLTFDHIFDTLLKAKASMHTIILFETAQAPPVKFGTANYAT
ncbi:hypothetical protein BpHYR1_041597 [Brachionus plicatilis]|uniref:Uncharacterized protein n=1 Tax=Brachionus plicatilis TaxID=10195 RepID=A0A3M7SRI0_BRAPC|nr:hypothetical protein BpHYR1_041597 [Brachionus plicatilis]